MRWLFTESFTHKAGNGKEMKMKTLITAVMLFLCTNLAMAGTMCDTRYQGNTIVSTDCELGSTNNDSETQVNLDSMFGFNDWSYAWKDDSTDALPDGLTNFSMDGDLLGGTFDITWASPPLGDVMFVLKDGNDDPDTYVGWLLDAGDFGPESYTFASPFLNTTSGDLKQISHGSFYYRNGGPTTRCVDCTNQVPEPSPLSLIGIGAMLLVARKKINGRLFG